MTTADAWDLLSSLLRRGEKPISIVSEQRHQPLMAMGPGPQTLPRAALLKNFIHFNKHSSLFPSTFLYSGKAYISNI